MKPSDIEKERNDEESLVDNDYFVVIALIFLTAHLTMQIEGVVYGSGHFKLISSLFFLRIIEHLVLWGLVFRSRRTTRKHMRTAAKWIVGLLALDMLLHTLILIDFGMRTQAFPWDLSVASIATYGGGGVLIHGFLHWRQW